MPLVLESDWILAHKNCIQGDREIMIRFFRQPLLVMVLILACLSFHGRAGASDEKKNPWAQSVYFENDLFNNTDSNYTNGVKYSVISPDLSPHAQKARLPRKALEWIHRLPFIRDSGPRFSHRAEFSLGQNMYTPQDTSRSELIVDDRPYAGWTYFGLAYHRRALLEEGRQFLDSVEIQMGMVGPLSFAEETQTLVHELRGIETAEGWQNQLKNEPGLVIAFERKWLFFPENHGPLATDAIIHTGGALGNVSTYFNGGLEVRFGLNLPRNFGVSLIRPAGSTRFTPARKPAIYLFAAFNGRYVLHDIFLDGNTFTDSHSIDKKAFVADIGAGLSVSYHNLMLTYTSVTRTREFKGQDQNHDFGSLTLSFFYPFW
jgi:hypothetical protein